MKSRPSFAELIAFNVAVIAQAQALVEAYRARAGTFAAHVGPHLRHIIEHYESLLPWSITTTAPATARSSRSRSVLPSGSPASSPCCRAC